MKPFVKYHGGKFYLASWIIDLFPPHHTYLEPFGGGGSVLLKKPRSAYEIYNDLNWDIYSIFVCLKVNFDEFVERLKAVQYNRETFEKSKGFKSDDMMEHAVWSFINYRMSRGGQRTSFAWSSRTYRGLPEQISMWETTLARLPTYRERLKDVLLTNRDAVESIGGAGGDWLIYCDPPYLTSTRVYKNAYACEMNNEDHKRLADALNDTKAKVVLSGYRSDEYDLWYKGWRREERKVFNHSSHEKVKPTKTECLWLNY